MKRLGILAVAGPSNGGTFQYTLSTLNALKRCENFKVTIYTSGDNHHYDDIGLPIRRLNLSRADAIRLAGLDIARIAVDDPFKAEDLLIAPAYSPVLLHTSVPFAFTLHDLQERYLPHNFTYLQRAWRRFLQDRLCRKATRIICESAFVQRDIVRFFDVEAAKVAMLPSPPVLSTGCDLGPAAIERVKAKYRLPERFVFYPAQFWAHKNHARLVEAFAAISGRFPDVQLLFTGARKDEFDRVFSLVGALGLNHQIRHLGFVEQRDLALLYRLALGLVMPSLFESVSIPVYEAQQAGTPVCASGVLAIADQVGDSGLTFDPLSVDSIGTALERLIGDVELRVRIGAAGQRRFQAMGWEHFDDRLQAIVAGLADAHS